MRKPQVSIIYVNYKCLEDINRSVSSIEKSKPKVNYEIVVVDNEGNTKLKKYTEGEKNIRYIKSPKNLGYSCGNNLGVKNARGEYVLILNPDTKLKSAVIDKLTQFLDKNKDVAIAAPVLVNEKGKVIKQISSKILTPIKYIFTYTFIAKLFSKNKIKNEFLKETPSNKPYEVDVVPGSALMIRKSVFNKLGGFDEKFFLYFEENDFCKRVKEAGFRMYKVPKFKVTHDWKPAEGNISLKKHFENSRFHYFKKHYGLISAILVESFSRISKTAIFIFLLYLAGLFLRLYKLDKVFPFSAEVGHNLLQLKNFYINKQIPLVGPPTSHPWLNFGPLFYWLYGLFWILSKFNPLSYGYFGAIVSSFIIPLNYIVIKRILGKRTAIISSVFTAFSPLFIAFSTSARFFNMVAIFIYAFILFLYKYLNGNKKYLFWVFFTMGVMLNFHYASIILIPAIFLLTIIKRTKVSFRDILLSTLATLLPLIPLIIYDFQNGFQMLGKFAIWIPYRIAGFLGFIPKNNVSANSISVSLETLQEFIGRSIITENQFFGLLVTIVVIFYSLYLLFIKKTKEFKKGMLLVLSIFVLGVIAIFIHGGSYILHYYLPIFPIPIIIFSHMLSQINNKRILYLLILIIVSINTASLVSQKNNLSKQSYISKGRLYQSLKLQKDITEFIINDSKGKPFSLKRIGPFDYYEGNHAHNYQYLLWYYGNEPVIVGSSVIKDNIQPEIKYTISENIVKTCKNNIMYESNRVAVIKYELK